MSGKYALIIGNTEYTDPGLAKLTAPGKDAEAFARVLASKELCSFDDVQVLLDKPEPVVREAVDGFFDQKMPDDLLVLYFSGHGVRDEYGSLYLAVSNTNRLRLRATAIKSDFIRESMDQSRSRRQILILDCCNSGAFAQGTKAATGVSIGTASAFEGTGYGRVVLTASDATQFAWEGDKVIGETENSLFTYFLVKGLQGEADIDGDGRITIDELYDYAYEQIVNVTPKQTPGKWSYKQQGEIVLRQSMRAEDIKPAELPDELIEEAEDTRPYVRAAAVQKLTKMLQGRNLGLRRAASEALEKIAADENTTRRVAQEATAALESFRKSQQATVIELPKHKARRSTKPENLQPEKSQAELYIEQQAQALAERREEEKRLASDNAAAILRAREVTEQLAAKNVRAEISERARSAKVSWRPIAIAGIAIAALAVLGYAGMRFLLPGQPLPKDTPAAGSTSASSSAATTAAFIPPIVLNTTSEAYSIAFSPDGKTLAAGSYDGTITLWDTSTRQPIGQPLKGHSDTVHTVAFSPDGKTLASGGYDNTIILWDVVSHKPIGQPLTGHIDSVMSLAFNPDGTSLASGGRDKTLILWDLATHRAILKVKTGAVESVAFSPDGKMLASGDDDGIVTLWAWDATRQLPTGEALHGHTNQVLAVAFSPDGKTLASGSNDNTIILWRVSSRKAIGTPLTGHSDSVNTVAFSPDGKILASGGQDNTVMLWDVARQEPIGKRLTQHTGPVFSVAFSPDGKTLASSSGDNTIMLWNVAGALNASLGP